MGGLAKVRDISHGPDRHFGIEKRMIRALMARLGDPPVTLRMGTGEPLYSPAGRSAGTVTIRDRKTLLKLFVDPELHFGDAYSEGRIDVEGDLVRVLETVFRSLSAPGNKGVIKKYAAKILHRPRSNTAAGSRDNIHHHYDIGNDFYRLWLDERMQYTCAYFPSPGATLEEAQTAKMDHVCRKLMLRPGETVVEAGCGWGTLALHMARHYGVSVRAYNISREQVAAARDRAAAEGLDHRVEYVEDDYRNIAGRYDVFVSVGMLEHVGPRHYRELGRVIRRSLRERGRGLIHSIGRNSARPMNPWIERRIFPGGYTPSLREMMAIFEPFGYSVLDVENLRLHYARTLEHWLDRFERRRQEVGRMFDQAFLRAWRLYLAGSVAAFRSGDLQLFQVVFAPQSNNDLPWTRAHVYAGSGTGGRGHGLL